MIVNQGHDTYKNDLQDWMETLEQTHAGLVMELAQVQLAQRAMLQFEAERLGAGHPRTAGMLARADEKAELIGHLAVEREIANIKVARAGKDDTLIHGRIVGDDKQGVAGMTVSLVNGQGEAVAAAKAVQTDAAGYYAFVLAPEQAAAVASEPSLAIAVAADKEKIVPSGSRPFAIKAGEKALHEVALNRDELGKLERRTVFTDNVRKAGTRTPAKGTGKTGKKK